jgi:hypothetical protein
MGNPKNYAKFARHPGLQYGGNPMVECIGAPVTGKWWDHPAYANDPLNPKVRAVEYASRKTASKRAKR